MGIRRYIHGEKIFIGSRGGWSRFFFGQMATSEAHAIEADKSTIIFEWQGFSVDLVANTRLQCNRCGKVIVVTDNVNADHPQSGYAFGCPGSGQGDDSRFGDRHVWHFQGIVRG